MARESASAKSGSDLGRYLSARRLTPLQSSRLERLRDAARSLAAEGGYSAVTMRAVAERAGVGLATVYRYFSSKDHLIADVHAQKSMDVIDELQRTPPRGRTPARRVATVFRRMLTATAEDLQLAAAGVAAITSSDPIASSPEFWNQMVMVCYMDVALGEEQVGDRQAIGEMLGHVFFSLMCGLAAGRMSLEEAMSAMDRAVALVFDGAAASHGG